VNYYETFITDEDYEKAAKNGISKSNVYQRVNEYGWELERAITVPVRKKKGGIYAGMITFAEQNGISKPTFFKRVKNGMDLYEAATKPVGYATYLELARKNGIKDVTFYQRITRGMKPYEAATKPVVSRKKVQQIS
jgi:predicted DNA-binding transcriptional regulator AlpA